MSAETVSKPEGPKTRRISWNYVKNKPGDAASEKGAEGGAENVVTAAEPSTGAKVAAEFVGTFLLIFTVGCVVLTSSGAFGGISIASVLMVSIYALGGISGANFNPAVSTTLGITQAMGGPGMDFGTVGMYVGVQLVAGVAAGFFYMALWGSAFNLQPAKGFGVGSAGACELLYTFMLCFVVLNVAVAKKNVTNSNQYYGLAIGYVIVAGAYGAGAVSGGCFNPAVALGIDASSIHLGFGWCFAYIGFELVGAALAAVAFMAVRPEDFNMRDSIPVVGSKLISEFLGTYILVLTVGLNVLGKSVAGAFSIAASLMCMIYALGDVSGAHFNPAVSVAILASGRCGFSAAECGMYSVTQIAGGVAAAFTYKGIYDGAAFPLAPGAGYGLGAAIAAEIVFTFVLCFVVLCVAVSEKTKTTEMFGLCIGSCVTVGGVAIGAVSGGSLNPAVTCAITASSSSAAVTCVAYIIAEVIGGGLAAGVFQVTHGVDLEKSEASSLA